MISPGSALLRFLGALMILTGSPASTAQPDRSAIIGIWTFSAIDRCERGTAWQFLPVGLYNSLSLPHGQILGQGRWTLVNGVVLFSPARENGPPAAPNRRMQIVEYAPDRLVAVTSNRVRHVMYRCPQRRQ